MNPLNNDLPPPPRASAPFPNPTLARGSTHARQPIMTSPGRITEHDVLMCGDRIWELGSLLKRTIYGSIVRSVLLERAPHARAFLRTQHLTAIKMYSKRKVEREMARRVENPFNEMSAMQLITMHHMSMSLLIEACEDDDNIYVVMRYIPGSDMCDFVIEGDEFEQFNERFAQGIFVQIAYGMAEIHALGWAHKDMSLENMMYDPNTNIATIIDFGMAVRHALFEAEIANVAAIATVTFPSPVSPSTAAEGGGAGAVGVVPLIPVFHPTLPGEPRCGKPLYISPEMQTENLPSLDFRRCDMWALGVMLFILLTGSPPMDTSTTRDSRFCIIAIDGNLAQLVTDWNFNLSAGAVELLQSMLRADPMLRPTAKQVLAHPWLAGIPIPQYVEGHLETLEQAAAQANGGVIATAGAAAAAAVVLPTAMPPRQG